MTLETTQQNTDKLVEPVTSEPVVPTIKQSKQTSNNPGPQPKDIIIDLSPPSRLEIISTSTSEKNQMIVNNGKISLTRGQAYKIPITNKSLNYDTSYVMKVSKDLRTHIQILDVSDGTVTISPMVHNTIIKSGDKIGTLL